MQYYIQIEDDTNNVTGYSSSMMNMTDILVKDIWELDNRFLSAPFFFRYNTETKNFDYIEDLENEYKKNSNKPSTQETLFTQIAQIKMQSIKKDTIVNSLTKQQAQMRIDSMYKDKILNNFVLEQAKSKIDSMCKDRGINMLVLEQAKLRIKNMQEKGDR